MVGLLGAAPLLLLLALAAIGHGLALYLVSRPFTTQRRLLTAAAQTALLVALLGLGLQALGINDPAWWVPLRAVQSVQVAGWLALLLYLVVGAWWRSPALGSSLPLLLLPVVIVGAAAPDASTTRGLSVMPALRPAVASLGTLALALALLGCAALFARLLEGHALGRPLLSRRVATGLLASAALVRTAQLGVLAYGWAARGRGLPAWTLQDTWLLTSWLVLLLAVLALLRGQRQAPALALLGSALLLLSTGVVAALGTRS